MLPQCDWSRVGSGNSTAKTEMKQKWKIERLSYNRGTRISFCGLLKQPLVQRLLIQFLFDYKSLTISKHDNCP